MEAEFFAGNRRTLKKFQRKPLCTTSLSTKRKLKEHEGLCINTNTLMSQPGAVFSLLLIGCVTLLTGCGSDSDSSPMMMADKNPAIPVNSGAPVADIETASAPSGSETGLADTETAIADTETAIAENETFPVDNEAESVDSEIVSTDDGSDVEPVVAPPPLIDAPEGITDLILITGQSNALGAQTAFDPQLDDSVDRFYAYTDNGWQRASLKQVWDLGWHPGTSPDTDPHNNFGMHFGKTISNRRSDRVVGIVLVTAPGEGISHWDPDGFFFGKIRNKALAALNALPHKSGFDGILWHQGETDWSLHGTNDPDLAGHNISDDYYSIKLYALINSFRNESWFDYSQPFICGETAQSPVNGRLMGLNNDTDYWTACAAGAGLPTYDDVNVHFNAEALRTIGANYAQKYLELRGLAN